ncbi:hypothetical protein [Nocardioides sp.]|uniref:hypothetical protein n=1 Tax=Nocardioides sp. TaxID=35761 RepID=UPI002600DECF|nr:hypothetical protein [Nocardioides sp.]
MFWLIVLAVAVVLFGLAWWSSGRAKGRPGRPDAGAESARGRATNQAMIHRDSGFSGPGG